MSRLQESHDVADREDVGVDHHGTALKAHQLGCGEAQRRERLQIVVEPFPLQAVAQVDLPLLRLQPGAVLGRDDPDVERLGRAAVAAKGILRDQGAQHLLGVGVDEDGRFGLTHLGSLGI
jgi:hypothetical protein